MPDIPIAISSRVKARSPVGAHYPAIDESLIDVTPALSPSVRMDLRLDLDPGFGPA
jgi:hypothetical protein